MPIATRKLEKICSLQTEVREFATKNEEKAVISKIHRKRSGEEEFWNTSRSDYPSETGRDADDITLTEDSQMKGRIITALFVAVGIAGCKEPSSPTSAVANPDLRLSKTTTTVTNPTAAVGIPLADALLNLKSDGAFSAGTNSVYANGVCGVTGQIFLSGSGDMVVDAGNPKYSDASCAYYPRRATVVYPDGTSDVSVGVFIRVAALQTSSFRIPVGSSARRQFNVQTSSSRCQGVYWGGLGGDSVIVTRTSLNTWHVTTQQPPNNNGACKNTVHNKIVSSPLGPMPVDLWITSSGTPLP